ncbi:MAG: putative quinone oxidoreductase [Ramlibacter sp.]|jgi:NADPH2:quinone reductase|nr:putative quinone oxidoreductase [Ramlibacter sp.]
MRAAGLNFPDLLMTRNMYQIKPDLPYTPGMEGAGVITEIGPGVNGYRIGDGVMFRAWQGCFAEEAIAPASELLPIPNGFSFAEAASFVVATSTATNALLQRGALQAGDTLLVHGAAGGVGLAAVQVGKLLGARVIATASTAEKLAVAAARGSDVGINYTKESFKERVLELTDGNGADVILDTVGGEVFEQSMRCIAWGGRLLVVGFASGRIPEVKMNQPLLKCFSIVGVRALEHVKRRPQEGEAYRAWMLEWAGKGELRPFISASFPLDRFGEALRLLEARQVIGRVVVEMSASGRSAAAAVQS